MKVLLIMRLVRGNTCAGTVLVSEGWLG